VDPIERIKEKAEQIKQKWFKGTKVAKLLYDKTA